MLSDENLVFKICGKTLTIISEGKFKKCPYDGSRYKLGVEDKVCEICTVSKIGVEAMGLKCGL